MSANVNINVQDITRVEGHGNIVVNVTDGKIEDLRLEITESPRFYEAMLLGRKWDEATHITCRICGICSCGHTTASLNACEDALGVTPSEQTHLLRRLLLGGEQLESHILHTYFLAAPDFLGVPSVLPLASSHPDVVKRALRLKRLANDICIVVAGRHIHPVAACVNGFTKLPELAELEDLKDRLVAARADLTETAALFKTLEIPDFTRETCYVSLTEPDKYAWFTGDIKFSATGETIPVRDYQTKIREFVVAHSHAKHAETNGKSYMVGALARVNNNYDQLCPEAKAAAEQLGLQVPCYNPFMNNVAQVVECVEVVEDAIGVIDELLARGLKQEDRTVDVRAGHGVGAADVPRGMLIHDYTFDDDGYITAANLVIPTNQNLNNVEEDMRALVPQVLDRSEAEITLLLEMLVRAYDPCISCATHLLNVEFVT